MPVLKNQDVKCLNCKTILHAVMGQIDVLKCKCGAVTVDVHQNYISTSGATDSFEITELEEIVGTYIALEPKTLRVEPPNEDKMQRVAWLLVETKKRVRELEGEIQRLIEIVDGLR